MTKKQFVKVVARGTLSADQAIGKMVDELQLYERKYGMRSEVFYALIPGTPAEDQPDFLNWAICYRSYFRALQSKFPFKGSSGFRVAKLANPISVQESEIAPQRRGGRGVKSF